MSIITAIMQFECIKNINYLLIILLFMGAKDEEK